MPAKGDGRVKGDGGVKGGAVTRDGGVAGAPTRAEFARLEDRLKDLEANVRENRRDLDVQFQRLAQLQAVIDRMQLAARKVRSRTERKVE